MFMKTAIKTFWLWFSLFSLALMPNSSSAAQTQTILTQILNLDDNAFFKADASILDSRESQLMEIDFFGVAVNAPAKILIKNRQTIPLIMALRTTGDRDWDIPLSENCILAGTNLLDGSVHFAKALMDEKQMEHPPDVMQKKPASRAPRPPGLASAVGQLTLLDPVKRLSIEWAPGIWSFGVLHFDWPSNTVVVKLSGDKESEPFSAMSVSPEPDKSEQAGFPSYFPVKKTPPLPDSGLAFAIESQKQKKDLLVKVFGSFAVKTRTFHLPDKKIVHHFENGATKNIAAVVPITLAILGLDWDEPVRFDWAVPVYGTELKKGMTAKGFFSIKELLDPDTFDTGPYACYLFMDGLIFGPNLIKIKDN